MAPQAPEGAFTMGVEPLFPHDFDELLLIASLWPLSLCPASAGL